ncbi:hypothetical protein TNCV_3980811 [Trichonephila clavipes]|nr:hypothetical protein TNCV_3980811 [Trichonephila clavipes]
MLDLIGHITDLCANVSRSVLQRDIQTCIVADAHSDLNHDSSIGHQLPANFHPLSQIAIPFTHKFRYLKACSFASFIPTSFLGFGWKRVAINSGPKEHVKEKMQEPVANPPRSKM